VDGTRRGSAWERGEVDVEVNDVDEGGEKEHRGVVMVVREVDYQGGAYCGGEETYNVEWVHADGRRVGVTGGSDGEEWWW